MQVFSPAKGLFKIITYENKNYFTVINNDNADFSQAVIVLRNITGQTLIRQRLASTDTQIIHVPDLTSGVYFATIFDGKQAYTQKVVVPR